MTSKNQTTTIEIPKEYNEQHLTSLPDWELYKRKIKGDDHSKYDEKCWNNPNIQVLYDMFSMNSGYYSRRKCDSFEFHGIEYFVNQKSPLSLPFSDLDKGLFFRCIKHLLYDLSSIEEYEVLLDALPKGTLKSRLVKKENKSVVTGKTTVSWGRQHFLMFKGKRHGVRLKDLDAVKSKISFRNKISELLEALKGGIVRILKLLGLNCDIDALTKRNFANRSEDAHYANSQNHANMAERFDVFSERGDILAIDDTYVASKNEVVLGNIFSMYLWPYYNEQPVYSSKHSNGKYISTVDFLFPTAVPLKPMVTKYQTQAVQDYIYVEIFGKLDDDGYAEGIRSKISNYVSVGIVPGYNFIGFACKDPRSINSRKVFEVATLALMGFIPKDIVVV